MKNSLFKKILTLTLAALLILGTAACGGQEEVSTSSESESTSVSQAIIEDEGEIVSVSQVESEPESEPEEEVPEVVDTTLVANEKTNLLTGLDTLTEGGINKRPIALSVNNISDSWPQYGISDADIIFEIPVEYNITRLMALYGDFT